MKENGTHEGCIEQIQRLYSERLFGGDLDLDEKGRIRIDDLEMKEEVQAARDRKAAKQKEKDDINNLKNEVNDIKHMLTQIIEKLNG